MGAESRCLMSLNIGDLRVIVYIGLERYDASDDSGGDIG